MSCVLLRLLVLLIMLGLTNAVVEASDLDTVVETALVDEVEDCSELDLIMPPAAASDPVHAFDACAATGQPPRYQHLLFVFRPPRAPAFN